jgi:hypothetical protein
MKMKFSLLSVALGVVALGTVFAPVARAGCGAYPLSSARGGIKPAAFVIGTAAADDWDFRHDSDAPIVGLWRVHFISEGNLKTIGVPDGTVIDQGYAAWHSDGTEIMNSGRDPLTGSVEAYGVVDVQAESLRDELERTDVEGRRDRSGSEDGAAGEHFDRAFEYS